MSQSDRDGGQPVDRGVCGEGRSDADLLDDYVRAFEESYQETGEAELAAFLPPTDHPMHAAVLRELVRVDLEFGWERGRPRRLDDYRRRFPLLATDVEGLRAIAFEEYRLRRQAGEDVSPREYREHFGVEIQASATRSRLAPPSWAPSLVWDPPAEIPALPEVGESFLGFRLLSELGEGSFGKVFLASETDMRDRPVVLKVTSDPKDESLTLAQLQHGNIVPVYSRHREGRLRAVCMPYLGAVTLRDVLDDLKAKGGLPNSGEGLLSSLEKSSVVKAAAARVDHSRPEGTRGEDGSATTLAIPERAPAQDNSEHPGSAVARAASSGEPSTDAGPSAHSAVPADTRERLGRLTYVEAALWMMARLADGLNHAHRRGILHLDLKPANVLLTDDGRPLLLDFNLSADLKEGGLGTAWRVGGTLPYMAPEHLRAFAGEGSRDGASSRVDQRSDLYALGVIAYEMLTGRPPFPSREGNRAAVVRLMVADRQVPPPQLRPWNPAVSPAAEAIIQRCLEPDPAKRYQSAAELFEDLERQLAHRPLRHASDPSRIERVGKWLRRNGRRLTIVTSLLAMAGFAAGLSASMASHSNIEKQLQANETLALFRERAARARDLTSRWAREPQTVPQTLALAQEAIRVMDVPPDQGHVIPGTPASPPLTRWERGLAARLNPAQRDQVRRELGVLHLIIARCEYQLAKGPERKSRLVAAREASDRARVWFKGDELPRHYWDLRSGIHDRLGEYEQARVAAEAARQTPLRDARDFQVEAEYRLSNGHYAEAIAAYDRAVELDPRDYASWQGKGYALERLGDYPGAVSCFNACIAIDERNAAGWFNRGVVNLQTERSDGAIRDFREARKRRSDSYDIVSNLGSAFHLAGRHKEAIREFSDALRMGAPYTRLYLQRAEALRALGDDEEAERDIAEILRREPSDELSWAARARARAVYRKDYKGALSDLDQALKLQPNSFVALKNKAALLAAELDQPKEAIAVLDRLLATYPNHAAAKGARAVVRARLGQRDAALADIRDAVFKAPSPDVLYYAACVRALTSRQNPDDKPEALGYLTMALRSDFGLDRVDDDHDLDPIRDDPKFDRIVAEARDARKAADLTPGTDAKALRDGHGRSPSTPARP